MMNVKFGFGQYFKPTPHNVALTVKIATVIIGLLIMWIAHTALLSVAIKEELSFDLGLITTAIHLIAPMFGIQVDDNATVKAKDVDVMDNKTT